MADARQVARFAVLIAAGLALFATAGCKGKRVPPAEVVAQWKQEHGAAAQEKLSRLTQIAADVAALPPAGPPQPVAGVAAAPDFSADTGNALLVESELLAQPLSRNVDPWRRLGDLQVIPCVAFALDRGKCADRHGEEASFDRLYFEPAADRFRRLEYVLVVRHLEYVPPGLSGNGLFSPGRDVGDVHLFALGSAQPLLGFSFSAATPESTSVTTRNIDSQLRQQLASDVQKAIATGLATALPTAKVPQDGIFYLNY